MTSQPAEALPPEAPHLLVAALPDQTAPRHVADPAAVLEQARALVTAAIDDIHAVAPTDARAVLARAGTALATLESLLGGEDIDGDSP